MAPPAQGPGGERVAALAAGKARIVSECASLAGWSVVDLETAARAYAVAETRDAFADELGHIPFTEEMYAAAATAAARWVRASCTKSKKVVVLDCDNTLWQGICGEGAVQVTEPYRKLQEFMLRQQDQGMLIALASKNNESDVMAVLDSGSCVLRSEHLTAWRINWQPKSENLRELSEELGLALNSFVFLDDSSYECLEVRNQCPEVTAIALPADAEAIPEFLEHLWVFDRAPATEEDRNRARMYQAERQRAELSRALTPEEFLASLKLEIEIAPAQSTELARVAQLTQRTTQFNMTGVTHNEQSLAALLAQGSRECRTVRVRDTFGDYGLVGVLLFAVEGASLRVENFLLSCRALGRRVEDRMVEELRRRAVEAGAERLCIPVVPTARNRPALEFLHRLCGVPVDAAEPFECVLWASGQESEWRPAAAAPVEAAAAPARHAAASAGEDIATLAGQLRTASAQMQAARASRRQRAGAASTAPRDEAERALAEIWSEYLGVAPVGIDDAFADLGGDSLTAARILARVHRQFGVGLTLAQFFAAPTVGGMAGALAQHA